MSEISEFDEFDRDWDWFAVDPSGAIGHFTSAGQRRLPRTVKADNDAALLLLHYFDEKAPRYSEYSVQVESEFKSGFLKDIKNRDWYLSSFGGMASAGLFSYDTHTFRLTNYFLVASPKQPLCTEQLPMEIRVLVERTRSPRLFSSSSTFSEQETLNW